ncbi:MAG: hypothetical protein IH876_16725 [Gemmatimonadetes bacterium]|nr:hypothetical protein [Gemmatimonadota bacterium]
MPYLVLMKLLTAYSLCAERVAFTLGATTKGFALRLTAILARGRLTK